MQEAIELFVQVGRVSHSWCICVIGHGNGGLDVVRERRGGWYACGTKVGGWSHVGRCRSTTRVRGDTLMTPHHTAFQTAVLGMAELELVDFQGKAIALDAKGRLRFVVHAADRRHSIVLHGRTCCSTNTGKRSGIGSRTSRKINVVVVV